MHRASATDPDAVHAVTEALRAAVNAGDVAGILACWASDGILLPPHHPAVKGQQAIAAYFRRVFAERRFDFTFVESEISLQGNRAVERLAFTVVVRSLTGESVAEDVGKGLHVFVRQPDGCWRLVQDIWNSNRPTLPLSRGTGPTDA